VLGAFANAFRTPDLRRKLLFVLLIVTIFRLGSQVPTPGVHVANVQACISELRYYCQHAFNVDLRKLAR
jgi:preprotein translocase subunit SecY